MQSRRTLEMSGLMLGLQANQSPSGKAVLASVLELAERSIRELQERARAIGCARLAAVGRLRGTGRGIHFSDLIARLEAEHPLTLSSPFENSHLVAGAAWDAQRIIGATHTGALAKLRWAAGANDLPMHVHEHSDRFIIVLEGRGFFHVSDQSVDGFDGQDVRSIPARERDVFIFTRGTVHTFSTLDKPMTLLSCQLPYLAFEDPSQYRLPEHLWTARDNPEHTTPMVGCDPAWTVLAGMCGC